jgi:hypothetical protein
MCKLRVSRLIEVDDRALTIKRKVKSKLVQYPQFGDASLRRQSLVCIAASIGKHLKRRGATPSMILPVIRRAYAIYFHTASS